MRLSWFEMITNAHSTRFSVTMVGHREVVLSALVKVRWALLIKSCPVQV
jgi:hypothetical protein